jgi:hypothetical protein
MIMEKLNIIEILKLGLPGLVFLLATLSYRLLSEEQDKPQPNPSILKSIRNFMWINVVLAVLTLVSPIGAQQPSPTQVYKIEASTGMAELEPGKAAVCQNADYANRNLLINDKQTQKLIQVFASSLIPCPAGATQLVMLNASDAANLGWSAEMSSSKVEVVAAPPGYKFEG